LIKQLQYAVIAGAFGLLLTTSPLAAANSGKDSPGFDLTVSAGAKSCLSSNAAGSVKIRQAGPVDVMEVTVEGLPANTTFNLFVIQVPKPPFGIAWYQGDIVTDKNGRGHHEFIGRFNVETFAFAQNSAPAPVVFTSGVVPDASLNPPFNPIHMYHLGLWFDSFQSAMAANCPATITPFNGEHTAGIQVLNTSNFADDHGPLLDIKN
jgi:hypothetical protein